MAPQITGDPFDAFFNEFAAESDRAAVILGAAKLDLALFQLLDRVLLPSTGARDDLLDSDGAVGTFSARIHLAFRMGLIDAAFTKALHIVRRIRNSFAHELAGSSLETGSHRDRVRELVAPFEAKPGYSRFRTLHFEDKVGPSTDFRCVLAVMALRLEGAFDNAVSVGSDNAYSLVPESFSNTEAVLDSASPAS